MAFLAHGVPCTLCVVCRMACRGKAKVANRCDKRHCDSDVFCVFGMPTVFAAVLIWSDVVYMWQ